MVLRDGTILMVEGRCGGWAKINPANGSPAPVWAHRLILGQAGNRPVGTILSILAGHLGRVCGRWLSGNNSNQKIIKL